MMRNLSDYDEPEYDDLDDYSLLDDQDEELDDLDECVEDDDIEISMEVDADGNEIYYAQDGKVPDSHSQGYSAEEVIEGLEQRRREFREMRRRSKERYDDEEEEADEGLGPDEAEDGDGVHISMEIDEDGNERWFATDPKVPGSASMGLSAEEAVDGLENRRQEYREMLKKSRAKSKRKSREQ
jgi:predicted RNase H-like HicB family nuclease